MSARVLLGVAYVCAIVFAVLWIAVLAFDQCGNEDTVECTPLGWALLGGWMVAGGVLGLLLLALVARLARGLMRSARRAQAR